MIWIQLLLLMTILLIGSRLKGIGLGLMGMLGNLVFLFLFHMKPAEPPLDVMMIILSIVTLAAAMQAAGGLDYLVGIAEGIIRSNPSRIVFIGPITTYFLCVFAGTSHIVYSLLPIIAEVSARKGIRPERPLSVSVVAAHMALTGSPMSAATATLAALMATQSAVVDIMKVCIPACFVGVVTASLSVLKYGKELKADPLYQEKMKTEEFKKWIEADPAVTSRKVSPGAKLSVLIFTIAILSVVICGAFPQVLPTFDPGEASFSVKADGTLKTSTIIEIISVSAAALIMLLTKTSPAAISKSSMFNTMAVAVVAVFGVVWMSSTFMLNNEATIKNALGGVVQQYPWTFAIAVFIMGALMFSQAGTTKAMMPLGLTLGLGHPTLLAVFPATNSDFVLPGYPTLLAAIQFDQTGSTRIGKYVFNHSFMLPGVVGIAVAIGLAFLFGGILL